MPTFPTPDPIDLAINLQVGRIDVVAGDAGETVVTVSPTNPGKEIDRRAAEATKVDLDGRRLTITGPKPRFSIIGPTESVDVRVELPAGSRLSAEIAVGGVCTTGTLGATRVKASMGVVELDTTGDLWVRAGHGGATVRRAEGSVEITADHGQIQVGTVTGDALLKASHGAISIGEAGGDVEAKLSYGDLQITTALGSVAAKTAYGRVQLHEVSSGAIQVESAYGELTIGVRAGVPAWLDLATKLGHVRNELEGDRAPEPSEQTVSVRARTEGGNITIRRAR
jgi:DUF4097 and DUF4098 domain-containing protein YvlB